MAFFGKAVAVIQGVVLLPRPTLAHYVVPFLEIEDTVLVVKRVLATVHLVVVQLEIAAHRKQVVLADAPVEAQSSLMVDGGRRRQNVSGGQFIVAVALVVGDRAISAVVHKTLWPRPIVGGCIIAENAKLGKLIIHIEATVKALKRHFTTPHRNYADALLAFLF